MSYIPKDKIEALCAAYDGECGIFLAVPFAGEVFTLNADLQFSAASSIKIPLLALLFKDAEEGRLDLDALTPLGEEGAVVGSGIIKFLAPDIRLSLYDYADQKPLTKDQADAIGAILAEARAYAIGYLHLYGEILPDRGAEGLMVSYYETIVAFIDAVAQSFDKKKEEIPSADYDAPPLPDAQV